MCSQNQLNRNQKNLIQYEKLFKCDMFIFIFNIDENVDYKSIIFNTNIFFFLVYSYEYFLDYKTKTINPSILNRAMV